MTKSTTVVLKSGRISLGCFFCGQTTSTAQDVGKLLCGTCTAKCADKPAPMKPYVDATLAYRTKVERAELREANRLIKKSAATQKVKGRGRGWHLKRMFEFEGKYYSFGTEVTKLEAKKLLAV